MGYHGINVMAEMATTIADLAGYGRRVTTELKQAGADYKIVVKWANGETSWNTEVYTWKEANAQYADMIRYLSAEGLLVTAL